MKIKLSNILHKTFKEIDINEELLEEINNVPQGVAQYSSSIPLQDDIDYYEKLEEK